MSDIEALEKLAEAITTIDRLEKELTLHAELEAALPGLLEEIENLGDMLPCDSPITKDGVVRDILRRLDEARKERDDNAD